MHPTGIQLEALAKILIELTNGKDIQYSYIGRDKWFAKTGFETWCPGELEYRVKPEPREVWVNIITGSYFSFNTKEQALERIQPAIEYDGIAVHFKEVVDEDK